MTKVFTGDQPGVPQGTINSVVPVESNWDETERKKISKMIKAKLIGVLLKNREAIFSADNPFFKFAEVCAQNFADGDVMVGDENIPPTGKIILAPNHQFGIVDVAFLVNYILKHHPNRPWAVVGNVNTFSRLFPGWEQDPRVKDHAIPVRRENKDTHAEITNVRELLTGAINFLKNHEDPILIIHPEGADHEHDGSVGTPHRGFAVIARRSGAKIAPVVFTGKIDPQKLKFDARGEICKPFDASPVDGVTLAEWSKYYTKKDDK